MTTSTLTKFLSICSLASIATTIFIDPASAKPIVYYGAKGTYTADYEAGTYRGCLNGGGCITLGRKYLLPCRENNSENCGGIGWRKGQYQYGIDEGMIVVSKNGQTIFQDGASITR